MRQYPLCQFLSLIAGTLGAQQQYYFFPLAVTLVKCQQSHKSSVHRPKQVPKTTSDIV
jgi:hypothetical protein